MKPTIQTLRVSKSVWQWSVVSFDGTLLGAGYCATQRDALNDARIFAEGKL